MRHTRARVHTHTHKDTHRHTQTHTDTHTHTQAHACTHPEKEKDDDGEDADDRGEEPEAVLLWLAPLSGKRVQERKAAWRCCCKQGEQQVLGCSTGTGTRTTG